MLLVALSLLCAVQTGCGTTSAPHAKVYVAQRDGPLYKAYDYSSDDGALQWHVTRWLSYSGPSAKAIATVYWNKCTPTCAGGTFVHAKTTVVFSGRVPCEGVSAYATYRVVKTSNAEVAQVGETYDLWEFCGYQAFTPSLPCLSHDRRAVSTAAQMRCYASAARTANARITALERSYSRALYTRTERATFAAAESSWRAYRQHTCITAIQKGEPVSSHRYTTNVCLFQLDESHLSDLTSPGVGSPY